MSASTATETIEPAGDAVTGRSGVLPATRAHLVVAAVVFVVAATLLAVAAIELAVPKVGSGVAFLSFGRLQPAAMHLLVYGWLTVALLGAGYEIVLDAAVLDSESAYLSLGLVAASTLLGAAAILTGTGSGRPWLEFPWWSSVGLLAGFVVAAVTITRGAARRRSRLGPAQWYLVGAVWWLVLVSLVGVLPAPPGLAGVLQTAFFRSGLTGLWVVAGGIGVAYHLVARLTGADTTQASPLSVLGFWSVGLVWAATGAAALVYGPVPEWVQTLGIAATIGLIVPVLAVATDLTVGLRDRWGEVTDRVSMRFVLAGVWLLLLVPLHGLVLALRTSNTIVGLTEWVPAFDLLVFGGAVTMWVCAFTYHAFGGGAPGAGRWHLRYTVLGLGLALAGMWAGGIVTGFTWIAGVNGELFANAGDGFVVTILGLRPFLGLRAVGTTVFALAQVLFLFGAFGGLRRGEPEAGAAGDTIDLDIAGGVRRPGWGALRNGIVGVFLLAALLVWVLPSLDAGLRRGTILGDGARAVSAGSAVATGRQVYLREGCGACHTQEVRPIVTDVGLGPVSRPGDYVHEDPVVLGVERLGPDLMHVGTRTTLTAEELAAHLAAPRVRRPWSIMPSYGYLPAGDLDALAQYLTSLK